MSYFSKYTQDEVHLIVGEKDAEIERLRGELEASRNLCQVWIDKSARQDKLITELCDALDRSDPIQISIQEVAVLIDRAREATR